MKAKFIYETLDFERGIDPKASMEIGMEGKLRSWLKANYGIIPTTDEIALDYCVMKNNLELVKYLIRKGTNISDIATNLAFTNKVDDEIVLWLLSKGDQNTMDYIKNQAEKSGGKLKQGWVH